MSINTITNHGIFFIRMLNTFEVITGCRIMIDSRDESNYFKYADFIQEYVEHEADLFVGFIVIVDKEQP